MHKPVMVREVLAFLVIREGGTYLDATLGTGGHARAMLERMGGWGLLLGLDRDKDALAQAHQVLAPWSSQCRLAHGNFADMAMMATRWGVERVDGILLDLGMSSLQIEDPARGFSFLHDGPLDMRMDRTQSLTAADILRSAGEDELADWLKNLGDEPYARRIARSIVIERERTPITTTRRLANMVVRIKGGRHGRIHPATRTFQALRIIVNREIECLEQGLESGIRLLKQGGRLAVLSYHSLEDRTVKRVVQQHIGRWESLPAGGQRRVGVQPAVQWLTRKPMTASDEEVMENPRARSSKLRVIERTA